MARINNIICVTLSLSCFSCVTLDHPGLRNSEFEVRCSEFIKNDDHVIVRITVFDSKGVSLKCFTPLLCGRNNSCLLDDGFLLVDYDPGKETEELCQVHVIIEIHSDGSFILNDRIYTAPICPESISFNVIKTNNQCEVFYVNIKSIKGISTGDFVPVLVTKPL
jgi:hypothetical protein